MFQGDGYLTHLRFPQKLWYLLNSRTDTIMWGAMGRTILLNYTLLDCYLRCNRSIFKTTHISSFIRQLNLYGFRKVTSHLQDPLCNASNPDLHEYMHDFFQYGKVDLLHNIKRKSFNIKKYATKFTNPGLKISRSFGSFRLRKARKSLEDAIRKASLQHDRTLKDSGDNNTTEENLKFDYNPANKSTMMPITWSNKASQGFPSYPEDYIPNCYVQVSSQRSIPPSKDYIKEMNLSTYIENFRVSEDINTPAIEETYATAPQDIFPEYYYCRPTPEEQVQPIDYKSFLNDNMVVVEVLDEESEYIIPEQSSSQWSDIPGDMTFTENETFFDQSDVIKMENPLPDQDFEDPCDKGKDEPFADSFGAPWEYKDILKDIVTEKSFPDQEYGTELKELYTQISKTIDLLNA